MNRASGSIGVRSTAGGTPGTRIPKLRDKTEPSDGQSPGGKPDLRLEVHTMSGDIHVGRVAVNAYT
jgi:hypothetical protein